mgnify:CR=1 FL=1
MQNDYKLYTVRRQAAEAGISLRKIRRWYDDTPAAEPTPTDTQPGQNAGTGTQQPTQATEGAISKEKLAERLAQKERSLLKDLGDFTDLKTAKELLAKARQIEQSQLSEAERQAQALQEAQTKAQLAEARIKELEHAQAVGNLNTLIKSLAEDAHNPQHVVRELESDESYAAWIEKPNEAQIKAALEKLRKGKETAYLFKAAGGRGSPPSPKGTAPDANKVLGEKKTWGL